MREGCRHGWAEAGRQRSVESALGWAMAKSGESCGVCVKHKDKRETGCLVWIVARCGGWWGKAGGERQKSVGAPGTRRTAEVGRQVVGA